MDSRFSLGQLDGSVDSTVKHLDQMLAQLEGYRPLLAQNVTYAEFDIRATFDSLIDALNQRQMQLLKQLEKIAKEKAGVIESQKQMIENLRSNIIACMSNRNKNAEKMQEYLSRAQSAVLSSSSAPFVSFRTEKPVMHQTISSYGRIISQYCGHFADPSQPSSCLPRALEEEDENDESIECGYNAQSMVFNRVQVPCTGIKPELRQWLSEEHKFDGPKRNRMEQKAVYPNISDVLGMHSALTSKNTTPLHPSHPIGCQLNPSSQTAIHLSPRLCDPVIVRHWLDANPTHKGLEKAREQNLRKLSQATSFSNSDITGGTDSESFVALTGSTSDRLISMKDWMFCNASEITEVPGLSEAGQPRPFFSPGMVTDNANLAPTDLFKWLAPVPAEKISNSTALPNRPASNLSVHQRSNQALLPLHLIESGPLDVARWLNNSTQVDHFVSETEDAASTVMNVADSELTSQSEAQSMSKMESIDQPVVTMESESTPDGCIYSQCRGGPGGPTCCGARKRLSKRADQSVSTENVISLSVDTTIASTTTTQSNLLESDSSTVSSSNPVVAQFTSIANTPLCQWLSESSSVHKESSTVVSGNNANSNSRTLDLKEWLLDTGTSNSSAGACLDDPESEIAVIPQKRRLCSITNDCLGCPCAGDTCDTSGGKATNKGIPNVDGDQLDQWLLKKLSVC